MLIIMKLMSFLPENKKWYKIASVNKKNETKYLAVSDDQVLLVDNIDEASAFEALDIVESSPWVMLMTIC